MIKADKIIATFIIFITLYSPSSNAALVELDFLTQGDSFLTLDTQTGREWLDLSQTAGSTLNETLSLMSSGGIYEGFQLASIYDVTELVANASGSAALVTSPIDNFRVQLSVSVAENLINLLGQTISPDLIQNGSTQGVISNLDLNGFRYTVQINTRTSAPGPTVETASFIKDFQQSNAIGHYIYRATVVPVPAAIWLFSMGLLAIIGVGRSRAKLQMVNAHNSLN